MNIPAAGIPAVRALFDGLLKRPEPVTFDDGSGFIWVRTISDLFFFAEVGDWTEIGTYFRGKVFFGTSVLRETEENPHSGTYAIRERLRAGKLSGLLSSEDGGTIEWVVTKDPSPPTRLLASLTEEELNAAQKAHERKLHCHQCPKCKHRWKHSARRAGDRAAHTCPVPECGGTDFTHAPPGKCDPKPRSVFNRNTGRWEHPPQ